MMKSIGNTRFFKGAGMLMGFAFAIVAGALIYWFTGNIAASVPLIAAFGVPIGISLEKKFQCEPEKINNPKTKKYYLLAILVGVVFLLGFYFLVKFI
mgnify:CR=1 FL=1